MKTFIFLSCITLFTPLHAQQTKEEIDSYYEEITKQLLGMSHEQQLLHWESIELNNGINRLEAYLLASYFFPYNINGCGGVKVPIDGGDHWLVKPLMGIAGTPMEGFIEVDKKNGGIKYREISKSASSVMKEYLKYNKELNSTPNNSVN